MARKVEVGGARGEWVTYIPAAFGIREAFEKAQATLAGCTGCDAPEHADAHREVSEVLAVDIRWLSASAYRKYTRQIVLEKKGQGLVAKNEAEVNESLMSENVRNVRNYEIGGTAVKTGKDLFLRGEADLVDEILTAITDYSRLSEGELGK